MSFLLDTDICSYHLKGDRRVWQKISQYGGQLHVSTVSVGELYTWALRKQASPRRCLALEEFLQDVRALDVTSAISKRFGELRAGFLDQGQGTPDMDLLIAATALVYNLTLVTHNVQDFIKIPGLRIQDWLES